MKVTITSIAIVFFLFSQSGFSQDIQLTKKDSIVKSSWIIGLGLNAVDDAGSEFTNVFDVSDNWNIVPFPSGLSVGKYFENGLGLEAIANYTIYSLTLLIFIITSYSF